MELIIRLPKTALNVFCALGLFFTLSYLGCPKKKFSEQLLKFSEKKDF